MDLDAYLRRIAYAGSRAPTAATLRAIQLAHLYAVPFENLDIHQGVPITLDEQRLWDKIVLGRRGGFCYELNGLLAAALQRMGYALSYVSVNVAHGDGTYGPDFDHLALLVRAADDPDGPERWLVDVGFGDNFRVPLDLSDTGAQFDGRDSYRVERQAERLIVAQQQPDGAWRPSYSFSRIPRRMEDFAGMCRYQQTSPDSHFTHNPVCTIATTDGRITLTDRRLITTRGRARDEQPVADVVEFRELLRQHFAIDLPGVTFPVA